MTFASRLAMEGHNEATIAALLRHSSTALVKRYAHLSRTHLHAAMESVASFGKTNRQPREPVVEKQWRREVVSPLEPASGIEPPTCGLRISGKGLLKSLKTWAIPAAA